MMSEDDIQWLERAVKKWDAGASHEVRAEKKLQGFSLLLRDMTRKIGKEMDELQQALGMKGQTLDNLQERLKRFRKMVWYLERFCTEKIGERYSQNISPDKNEEERNG